jgi:CheY-like chemotaxis protein
LPTILVVEDFDDTRLMMKMWLVKNGYRVLEAETEKRVEMAQKKGPTYHHGYDDARDERT